MTEHMPISNDAENLIVRPARPEDREAVLAFCAHTWDGGDYIAAVWDDWLTDTTGVLLVAVLDERPVGLTRLAMLSAEDAWLEGMRVDPTARRQGIARVLTSQALVQAHERGATAVRLMTDQDNIATQGLITKKFGFQRVAEVAHYIAPALEIPFHGAESEGATSEQRIAATEELQTLSQAQQEQSVEAAAAANAASEVSEVSEISEPDIEGPRLLLAGAEDHARIWQWLEQSNLSSFNGGLQFGWWRAWALTEQDLREYLTQGVVWLLEEWEAIQSLAIVQERPVRNEQPATLQVAYIDGAASSLSVLALALREIAQDHELQQVELWLPELLILHDAMDGAGYSHADEQAMWVYARTL